MKKFLIIAIVSIILATVFSCGRTENTKVNEPEEQVHADEHGNPNIATLTEEQIKSIGIEFGSIEKKQLTSALRTNGVLKVPNQNKASINSLYSGVVKSLLVQPGNYVKKGQTIATVANPEFIKTQSDYLNVSAKIGLAELEAKRQKDLTEGNAGALKNLQAAETELSTLRTAKATLEQQIQLMGLAPERLSNGKLVSVLSITSPISGVVSSVKVELGRYVDVTTPVAEIVDNSQLHLDLFVYEKDLPKLKNNQTIHFTITNNPGKEYDAQIFSLGSSFEGESKAITVHAMVKGDKTGLIDGMNVTAVISLNQITALALPNDAIVTVDGQDYVFVLTGIQKEGGGTALPGDSPKQTRNPGGSVKEEYIFERIPLAKGVSDVGYTEITLLKEIPNDAKLVVKGAFFVSAKMTNTEGDEH
ncbi:MAG TPA: efflux RND transporter periplasmic adaptor subunit [Flavitalea sp.]|nr:efflux RND transporter periplasmic adaptor subunit [Flavitalea sp.]